MTRLDSAVDALAAKTAFSGVVRVEQEGRIELSRAYGLADRAHGIPNTPDTRFGTASATKSLTALAVVSLIEEGRLELETTARSVLGSDLPLIADDVTVEHLLAHRSGIGDYLDEDEEHDPADYLMPVPVHELAATEDFLAVLDGQPTKFPAGERFSYSNGGYVVLALIAERASGVTFHDLVRERVCEPARMTATEFLRSDELPGDVALGYLEIDGTWRTNIFHLPVRGNGDGGVYTTAADVSKLWHAFLAGRLVSPDWVATMVRPRSDVPAESMRYGLGFWLHATTDAVLLIGGDTGVSFRSVHDPGAALTHTVISNSSNGARAVMRLLDDRLGTG